MYLLEIFQGFLEFSHGKISCASPIITLQAHRFNTCTNIQNCANKMIVVSKNTFEYLESISIAFVASCTALPYSSSFVCANARLAQ
jgi:hypothetical protein